MNIAQILAALTGQTPNMLAAAGQAAPQPGNMLAAAGQPNGGASGSWDPPPMAQPAPPVFNPRLNDQMMGVQGGLSQATFPPGQPQQDRQAAPPLPAPRTAGPTPGSSMPPIHDAVPSTTGSLPPAAARSAMSSGAGGMGEGLFDRWKAGFNGQNMLDTWNDVFTGLASGKDFNSSIGNAGLFVAQGKQDRKQEARTNQTRDAAIKLGLDPQAAAGFSGRELASYIINKQKGIEPTDDIREYQFAKQSGFTGSFEDWQVKKKGAGANEYGVSPVYGTDANGNPVIFQLGKQGGAKPVDLPPGVKPSTGIDKIDLGTQWALQDKKSGQVVGYMPKDVAGEKREGALGAAQGAAASEVPAAQISTDALSKQIDDLKSDPDFGSVIGSFQGRIPASLQGESQRRVQAKIDQLKGGAFLQAYQTLKGGGAITEVEGGKATAALARMDQAQSEEDFSKALDDFRDAANAGLAKLRARAGQGGAAAAAPAAPAAPPRRGVYDPATGTVKWQ